MIQLQQVYLQYGNRVLFDKIDLTIVPGEKIGLVGRNGAGKSTLLRLLAGESKPDEGKILLPKGITIGYLHQDLKLRLEKKVIEIAQEAFDEIKTMEKQLLYVNEQLGERTDYESDAYHDLIDQLTHLTERLSIIQPEEAVAETERILKGLGFKQTDFERTLAEFSGGWQMRVELAKLLLQKPDYLLLDEPTNHLDIESIIWLENFLKVYPGTILLISHDKQFLDSITTRTVEVEMGKVFDYKANYSKYLILREERREKLLATYENQQKVIAEREKTINRFMAKATKTKMAQSMQKQLNKMERVELDVADTHTMKIRFPPSPRSAQIVLKAKEVSKDYGVIKVLDKVDFEVERGQRVAFVGQNGQGKTTLAKLLIGEERVSSGQIEIGQSVQIGYYAQNQAENLDSDKTVLQVMEDMAPEDMRTRVRSILGAFMFSGEDVDKKVKVLSGGERARLALSMLLLKPINTLLLDEPTNHLDMLSKDVLKQALLNYDGTLLVVSHDREFLKGLTDQVVEFRDRSIKTFLGDIDYYLEKRAFDNMRSVEMNTQQQKVAEVPKIPVLNLDQVRTIQRNLQNLEKKIEKTETLVLEMESQMADPEKYNSPEYPQFLKIYNDHKSWLESAYKEWESMSVQLEV
ncbi:MAG: ABC-F family ATP-binding cassette domain-containing protein [Saprospiraceae bacterium]|nr:ABC-F family ATP-binding cassette domain-containing protein [Saprospiraceae bacterium]